MNRKGKRLNAVPVITELITSIGLRINIIPSSAYIFINDSNQNDNTGSALIVSILYTWQSDAHSLSISSMITLHFDVRTSSLYY